MKQIDWQLVTSNPQLASSYATAVHNRFEVLSEPNDDLETQYQNITATEEIVLQTLPKKKKQTNHLSSHSLAIQA